MIGDPASREPGGEPVPRGRRGGPLVVLACLMVLAAILSWAATGLQRQSPAGSGGPGERMDARAAASSEERAVAVGLYLDSGATSESIDRGLGVAEGLRRRYGIDTGDPLRDREEAARRAQREVLDGIAFTEQDIEQMASSLGYSLDPDRCRTTCENIRNLAVLELKKRALEAFAAGTSAPNGPAD